MPGGAERVAERRFLGVSTTRSSAAFASLAVRPVSDGAAMCNGPLLTQRCTLTASSTSVPWRGACRATTPLSYLSLHTLCSDDANPSSRRMATAWPPSLPTTAGTVKPPPMAYAYSAQPPAAAAASTTTRAIQRSARRRRRGTARSGSAPGRGDICLVRASAATAVAASAATTVGATVTPGATGAVAARGGGRRASAPTTRSGAGGGVRPPADGGGTSPVRDGAGAAPAVAAGAAAAAG